jgi:hypothetical protein
MNIVPFELLELIGNFRKRVLSHTSTFKINEDKKEYFWDHNKQS